MDEHVTGERSGAPGFRSALKSGRGSDLGAWARRSWRRTRWSVLRMLVRVRRRVPPGLRLPLGLLLMVGGVFGMLPVLGFWMLPLGVAVAALDVRPMVEAIRRRWAGRGDGPERG